MSMKNIKWKLTITNVCRHGWTTWPTTSWTEAILLRHTVPFLHQSNSLSNFSIAFCRKLRLSYSSFHNIKGNITKTKWLQLCQYICIHRGSHDILKVCSFWTSTTWNRYSCAQKVTKTDAVNIKPKFPITCLFKYKDFFCRQTFCCQIKHVGFCYTDLIYRGFSHWNAHKKRWMTI